MTAPSASYRQHHAGIAPPRVDASTYRLGWRIVTRLDRLLGDGAISAATWAAAVRYRDDWELSLGRRRSVLMVLGGGASGGGDPERRLDALGRVREANERIGAFYALLVEQCVVLDLSWTAIARHHGTTDKTARRWGVAALEALGL